MEDSEEDTDTEEPVQNRGRKKVAKKRPRSRYKNRGYYESSSGGEEADSETSRSPARKKPRETVRNRRRATGSSLAAAPNISQGNNTATEESSPSVQPQLSTDVRFPPGLLAANPSLAGAKPGSLVVVASPSKTDPSSKLLCVYMVRQKGATAEVAAKDKNNKAAGVGSNTKTMSSRVTLDPAVVRAVDRTRLAEREEGRARGRTVSECKDSTQQAGNEGTRQRTCSEGSGNLRTQLVRQRFLSGTGSSMPEALITSHATSTNSPVTSVATTSTNSTSPSTIVTCNTIANSTTTSTQPIARKSKVFRGKKSLPDS